MRPADIIIIAAVLAAAGLIIRRMIKRKGACECGSCTVKDCASRKKI